MLKKSLIMVSLSVLIFLAACTKPNPVNTDQDIILPQEQIQNQQEQVVENSNTRNTCGEFTDQKWFWPDSYLVSQIHQWIKDYQTIWGVKIFLVQTISLHDYLSPNYWPKILIDIISFEILQSKELPMKLVFQYKWLNNETNIRLLEI